MLYIAATAEDLKATPGLESYSLTALQAIVDAYEQAEINQEVDAAELRGEWWEYEDAGKMWRDWRQTDYKLPHFYDPEQLEALTDAIAAAGHLATQLKNGNWLVMK